MRCGMNDALGGKSMKKLAFCVAGAAALALSACGSRDADTLNEAEAQTMEDAAINNLASEAANAAELEALDNQAQQLENESAATANTTQTTDNAATSPSEVEDDVQGM
jgi:hypothetical protein